MSTHGPATLLVTVGDGNHGCLIKLGLDVLEVQRVEQKGNELVVVVRSRPRCGSLWHGYIPSEKIIFVVGVYKRSDGHV